MSRQEGYQLKNRHLMSAIDTDLDALDHSTPPSPPPVVPQYNGDNEENGQIQDDMEPPQTPYYDYACNFLVSRG